jgi:molybdate transport system substrate-binding protein
VARWLAVFIGLSLGCSRHADVRVAAAISLEPWLTGTLAAYRDAHPEPSYGASGILEKQIAAGAPVEVFLSASPEEVEALGPRVVARDTVAKNRLVLALSKDAVALVHAPADLESPAIHRVAVGRPNSVPAGRYAQQTLEALGLWRPLLPKMLFANNVAEVRAWVERGDVEAGFVYATEAAGLPAVRPLPQAPVVEIVAALLTAPEGKPPSERARRLYEFLTSPERLPSLQAAGFSPP